MLNAEESRSTFLFYEMKHFWLPILWALVILALCAMPGRDIPHISWLEMLAFDKWVHAGVFFALSLLIVRGLKFSGPDRSHVTSVFIALAIAIPYGGALEIMQQTLFSERSADIYDFIANSFGAACGVLLYRKLAVRIKFLQSK